jgi:bacterioferritin-associated ferredoxin
MNAPTHHSPTVRTTCPYYGVGCGVLAKPDGNGGTLIAGDPEHPANFGKLCSKGSAPGETLRLETRLLYPTLRRADGTLTPVSWDDALGHVANGIAGSIARHGPDAVAFYLFGQLLTEDYYVANKLMKGFLGSANVDTSSRLCMASTVAGHARAFGADMVPGAYADLDEADLVVLVGSNAAWCHPVLYRRIVANRRARSSWMVVIDPRRTASAEEADLYLAIAPGMDTALFCSILVHLADAHALDHRHIDQHTSGIGDALARAREIAPDVNRTAAWTGLTPTAVTQFFTLFRAVEKAVTRFSQGVNQSAQGTDKVNAIIDYHLATGRIGKPGTGPFSLTGQPNAMGGREVGGLANQLAAHMSFSPADIERIGRFWRARTIAQREGLKAVPMFEAIERGQIKALWVMATNPAVSLPRADAMDRALAKLDLFVVLENVVANDSIAAGAHRLEPAARRSRVGALRRSASRRCGGPCPARWRFCSPALAARRMRAESRGQRWPAARVAIRADPLERRDRVLSARRRFGGSGNRSGSRAAGKQGDAGCDHAGRFCLPGFGSDARAADAAAANVVGTHRGEDRPWSSAREQHAARTWRDPAQNLFAAAELAELMDEPRGLYRIAAFANDRQAGCLFIGPMDAPPPWDAVKTLLETQAPIGPDRRALLSGETGVFVDHQGPLLCACFGVGFNAIRAVLAEGAVASVAEIGRALGVGTNCGSCRPELKRIVTGEKLSQAA